MKVICNKISNLTCDPLCGSQKVHDSDSCKPCPWNKEAKCISVEEVLKNIEAMDHYTMCKLWRFQPEYSEIYFRNNLPFAEAFINRLFNHFGGFTPQISKALDWGNK